MQKLLIIWLIIIKSTYLSSCGVPKLKKTELIVNGHNTAPGAWPWHVAIFRKDRNTVSYICGGTLISEIFVLTAAHCVRDENGHQISKRRIFVRLGVHNLDVLNTKTLQQHVIENIYIPSKNDSMSLKNDIALLELATVAEFTDYVQPACVSVTRDLTGQLGTVIGWGVTESDEVSPVLKSAQMPAIDPVTCLESDRELFGATLDRGIFCAGYTNGTSVCNGDSGGGIFFNVDSVWYLGGIVSYSQIRSYANSLCYTKGYAGFTKVYTYLSWISSITEQQFLIGDDLPSSTVPPSTQDSESVPCTTPTKQPGQCVPIHQCRNINEIVTNPTPPPPGITNYINRAACSLPNVERSICCQPAEVVKEKKPLHPNAYLLPRECGLSVNDRIAKGNVTKVFDYPWMAVLQYEDNGRISDICGGTLINKRYILTAGHCIKTRPSLRLVNIRLGEHTKNQERDCNIFHGNDDAELERDCAKPPENYGIESFVIHPDYNRPRFSNDIGLIRLSKDVVMQDHITPICLPITPELQSQVFEKYIVTGWGQTENSSGSDTLLEAILPWVDNTKCQQILAQRRQIIPFSDKQICAGGQNKVETCRGDTGGPLGFQAIYYDMIRFVQFGITSAGMDSCGLLRVPGIYTRVGSYMNWILDNLEP